MRDLAEVAGTSLGAEAVAEAAAVADGTRVPGGARMMIRTEEEAMTNLVTLVTSPTGSLRTRARAMTNLTTDRKSPMTASTGSTRRGRTGTRIQRQTGREMTMVMVAETVGIGLEMLHAGQDQNRVVVRLRTVSPLHPCAPFVCVSHVVMSPPPVDVLRVPVRSQSSLCVPCQCVCVRLLVSESVGLSVLGCLRVVTSMSLDRD